MKEWGIVLCVLLAGCQLPSFTKPVTKPVPVKEPICPKIEPVQCAEPVPIIVQPAAPEPQINVESILSQPAKKRVNVAKDSYLFPYDMSQWACADYIQTAYKEGHLWRLQQLLRFRPHQFYPQVTLSDLVELPLRYAPKQRRRPYFHYHKVHHEVLDDLINLLNAAEEAGYPLRVQSGFRGVDRQNLLWQGSVRAQQYHYKKAAYRVAPPCFSEHATGKAVDFSLPSIQQKVAKHPVYQWLRKNAHRYGWEQSFIKGEPGVASSISKPGVMPEAWHFRHRSIKSKVLE